MKKLFGTRARTEDQVPDPWAVSGQKVRSLIHVTFKVQSKRINLRFISKKIIHVKQKVRVCFNIIS